jgi:hypothetical protein
MSNDEHAWLSIDEQTDVLVSLSGCLHSLTEAHREPAFWKHVIVNLHNALQGAMVCQLSGTAQLGALDKKSLEKTLEWLRLGRIEPRDNCVPHARLADARTLFARIHKKSERKEDAGEFLAFRRNRFRHSRDCILLEMTLRISPPKDGQSSWVAYPISA